MKKEKANVGFLGVGSFITKQHLPNAFRCPWLKVHTLCDLDKERLRKFQKLYSPERVTTDYREMLTDSEIDIIVIAMDPSKHSQFSIEAMRSGKHVYVEKPLAEDINSALEVIKVYRETKMNIAVGFNRRFAPAYQDVYEIIKNEKGSIMINYHLIDDLRDRPVKWVNRPRLLDECCHQFDIFNWFAKSEPVRIFATETGRKDDHNVIVEYENGVTASLFTSTYGAFHWPKERLEIVGDNKIVVVDDFVELQTAGVEGWKDKKYAGLEYDGFTKGYTHMYETLGLPFYRQMRSTMAELLLNSGLIEKEQNKEKWSLIAEKFPEHLRFPINYSCDKGWYNALAHFGKCILDNVKPRNADAVDAIKTVDMSLAAMESIKSRQPVEISKYFKA